MNTITLQYHEEINNELVQKELAFSKELLSTVSYAIESLFVIKVQGQSMQPKINDNALVVADLSQKEFVHEGIYLVYYEDKMWIKQAKQKSDKQQFVSINPAFSHLIYDAKEVRVIAKALLTFTTL